MKPRTRVLAALLALFAFTAAFAEQVWASTCAELSATQAARAPGRAGGASTHGADGCDQEMPMPAHPDRHSRAPSGGDCPFQAIAAGGCVLFTVQAPQAATPGVAATPATRMAPASQAAPALLLASPRFRPPQA